ncbi:MAG: ERCC4 domain-containing protein [Nanoarchaeota archaeon]
MTFFNIFSNKKIKQKESQTIIADHREKNSLVISELISLGNKVQFEQLDIADYIINNIAIERKTQSDLASSIIDKRIFSQLENLKQYQNSLLILEQDSSQINMHENAIKGFLLSIALKFKVPIIYTKNEKDTAKYLTILANKKQSKKESIRPLKRQFSKEEQIRFILEGFPGIGPVKTKEIMDNFKNLKDVANASKEILEKIIGKQAEEIYNLFNQEFEH